MKIFLPRKWRMNLEGILPVTDPLGWCQKRNCNNGNVIAVHWYDLYPLAYFDFFNCWSCVICVRCNLAACQVLTLYEYSMQFKLLQSVFFWGNNFCMWPIISLHLFSGLFNCWNSWLYGTWSAVEEGIWNGVRLVVPWCNHVWDAYRLSSLLLWWSKDHMPQGCTKLWFSIILLEFFIFAKSLMYPFLSDNQLENMSQIPRGSKDIERGRRSYLPLALWCWDKAGDQRGWRIEGNFFPNNYNIYHTHQTKLQKYLL